MPDHRLKIVVLGYIVRGPLGGLVWHHLQYVLGLSLLGHDVLFVEDSDDYASCFNPDTCTTSVDPSYGLAFAKATFDLIGLSDIWTYHDAHTNTWHGPAATGIHDQLRTADLLLNLSGVNPIRDWFAPIDNRVLIDTDPVFTQIKHLKDPAARQRANNHTAFLTFAENFGLPGCTVPDDGYPWQPTRQPVVLDCWSGRVEERPETDMRLTSILQWDSYPPAEYDGQSYGMKSVSFRDYMELPAHASASFELAIGSDSAPRDELQHHGWSLQDPLDITRTARSYRRYLKQSHAEFGIAKHGYVASASGWFSERSANYLASAKPVVLQSTGFANWLKTDEGVLSFSNPDQALSAIDSLRSNYRKHAAAALQVANEYFSHDIVLADLLERVNSQSEWTRAVGY